MVPKRSSCRSHPRWGAFHSGAGRAKVEGRGVGGFRCNWELGCLWRPPIRGGGSRSLRMVRQPGSRCASTIQICECALVLRFSAGAKSSMYRQIQPAGSVAYDEAPASSTSRTHVGPMRSALACDAPEPNGAGGTSCPKTSNRISPRLRPHGHWPDRRSRPGSTSGAYRAGRFLSFRQPTLPRAHEPCLATGPTVGWFAKWRARWRVPCAGGRSPAPLHLFNSTRAALATCSLNLRRPTGVRKTSDCCSLVR